MSDGAGAKFSAADASLGYLYQVRLALLWTLQRLKEGQDFLVGVETLDDVSFETVGGTPTELLQTKHHVTGTGTLTDASVDLWKTLRVWFEGHVNGEIPETATLFLVTTAVAPVGSVASHLRPEGRNVSAAQTALAQTALSSSNVKNKPAYDSFVSAGPSAQAGILDKVFVLDSSQSVTNLDDELRNEVYWATVREHQTAFLERLEGWWLRRILVQLANVGADRVGSIEVEAKMNDLREQFSQEALPIDDDLAEFAMDEASAATYGDHVFVLQIGLSKAGNVRVASAIRDYYRAFEQRSRWLREELVVGLDVRMYEKRLKEAWELSFAEIADELGVGATERAKEAAARRVLAWAEQALIPIRPGVTEPFVSRGSLHMLSDEMRIGWHVDFRAKLEQLLGAARASA